MSQETFQTTLARLVIDRDFQTLVASRREAALPGGLSERECRRLIATAESEGLDIARTIHNGWRLGKVLSLLPLTSALLGDERLAAELKTFWRDRPPTSLHFWDEAIAFCDHLDRRRHALRGVSYLDEVLAFERARIELSKPALDGPARTRRVPFRHDPARLFDALAEGKPPPQLPEKPTLLLGTRTADGAVTWVIQGDARLLAEIDGAKPGLPEDNQSLAQH